MVLKLTNNTKKKISEHFDAYEFSQSTRKTKN